MEENDFSAKRAYTKEIAASYEFDRESEKIWQSEQAYMTAVVNSISKSAYLLDLPVGTGRFLDYYQKKNIHVLGVDISEHMLTEARGKITTSSIELAWGDVMNLDYTDNTFTHLVCFRLLHLIPPQKLGDVVKELARVTSGTLYFQAYVRDSWFPLLKVIVKFSQWAQKIRLGSPDSQKLPWGHIQSFNYDKKYLLKVFKESGLVLEKSDSLGFYGALNVMVYVLKKA